MINVMKYCEAAENIKDHFGLEKSLKYLIGEKFYNLLKQLRFSASDLNNLENPEKEGTRQEIVKMKEELSGLLETRDLFVSKIKEIYQPYEIAKYLNGMPLFGAAEQFLSEEGYKEWRIKGVLDKNVLDEADDSFILTEMKELLL